MKFGGVEPLAVERREGQRAREDFALRPGFSRADAARQMRELDLGQLRRKRRLDVGELDVGDDLARFLVARTGTRCAARRSRDAICPGSGSHSRHAATSA